MRGYDFTEPLIRDMVDRHHPQETIIRHGDGSVTLFGVSCDICGDEWPCRPVVALREWRRQHGKDGRV